MPDHPDDARKRHQRGVFPPFFAPRNGRGESPPTPPSGSWRRVSRLFTPPDVARQRRTPAAPQQPYAPPVTPAAADVSGEGLAESTEARMDRVEEVLDEVAPVAPVAPVDPVAPEAPEELALPTLDPEDEPPYSYPSSLDLEEVGADELARFDPMAFDEEPNRFGEVDRLAEVDRFVVESLEQEPISLTPPELGRLEVEVDFLDSLAPDGSVQPADNAMPANAAHDMLESIESYIASDDEAIQPARSAEPHDTVEVYDALPTVADAGPAGDAGMQPAESDPWAGAELPEPAFGSIGWPPSEAATPTAVPPVDGVEEMGAALAWSDAEEEAVEEHTAFASGADGSGAPSGDDVLSAMAHELRDSSSAWVTDGEVQLRDEADVDARARFYGSVEAFAPRAELEISGEAGDHGAALSPAAAAAGDDVDDYVGNDAGDDVGDDVGDDAGDDAGAAIADALARVAARIRAGEVELPTEAVGSSDESALAAALAALLRGPRH